MKRWSFLSVIAFTALACRSDRPLPGPSALIKDALNNGGNAFFFWLHPVVNQQSPSTQVFSKQLRPTVTITDEGPAGAASPLCHAGDVIRTFAGSDIAVSSAHFHANWKTADDNLHAECTYRITVSVGSEELGFADVDVVSSGKELKNVHTNEFIALLDDRTLPIKFFVGVGSLCDEDVADCGEGIAVGGENTTIVTTSGRAGVFIPADAIADGEEVRITIQSVDSRTESGECIPGLQQQFPGTPGGEDNGCYDYDAEPVGPQIEDNGTFTFNTDVTVGICPASDAPDSDDEALELLQIFQFDAGREDAIRALNNVPAPFLTCDPNYSPSFGSIRSRLGDLAARGLGSLLRPVALLIAPRPLFASTRTMAFDLGSGGSTDEFSRFTWALPTNEFINFDLDPEGLQVAAGTVVNTLYSHVGVTFSRTMPSGLCAGNNVYANDHGPGGFNSGQNNITVCPEGEASPFSEEAFGAIKAVFKRPAVQVCIDATPIGEGAVAFLEAFDASGESLSRDESDGESLSLCVRGTDIASVRFAGAGAGFAIFDNLSVTWAPLQPVVE